MIGIKVNGRFLDLRPGSSSEIERKSPFFAIDDYASETTTDALVFPYTQNNAVALDLPYQYFSERKKKTIEAEHYDGNSFRGPCTLIIETGKLNINNIEATEISGYIVYSISHFFQFIKGKKLRDLTLGGVRTFNWTTNVPDDGSNGFWQHCHKTWTDDSIPYVFAPIRDEGYIPFDTIDAPDFINGLNNDGKLRDHYRNPIVPMIRIPYLFEQIFKEHGFDVDFTGINDVEWKKLILESTIGIEWQDIGYDINEFGQGHNFYTHKSQISFSLHDHVPQQQTISDFLVQWFFRYGIAPVFSLVSRKAYMVAVKELRGSPLKDWTRFAEPDIDSSFNEDKKIFAFTNEIDSNDQFPSAPDFSGIKFTPPSFTIHHVPDPASTLEGQVVYCWLENQWYQAQLDDTSNRYEWKIFADNIYSEEPEGATDTIATTISTLPVYLTKYRTVGPTDYYAVFPMIKQEKGKPFGYRTLIYHGMVKELTEDLAAGVISYPYASSIRQQPGNFASLTWSNVYRHKEFGGTVFEKDFGIIQYWWQDFLHILQQGEDDVFKLWLPLHELLQFRWSDRILIQNLPYLVKSIIEPVPYLGFVQATLRRIPPVREAAAVVVIPGGGSTGTGGSTGGSGNITVIYAKIEAINIHPGVSAGMVDASRCDIRVILFEDAAGTVPFTPTTPVSVLVSITLTENTIPSNYQTVNYNITASTQLVQSDVLYEGHNDMTSWFYTQRYKLEKDPNNKYVVIS